MSPEFDYQWKNIPSKNIEYNQKRVDELLSFTGLSPEYFNGKSVLDAGCGNGRYTYALMELGAKVRSIDISPEAINTIKKINANSEVCGILELPKSNYDFVLSWGVIHHTQDPYECFLALVNKVKPGGRLHIMVYSAKSQRKYTKLRRKFAGLNNNGKMGLCEELAKKAGDKHGWWDALNPKYNHGYTQREIIKWYEDSGFTDIRVAKTGSININGKI